MRSIYSNHDFDVTAQIAIYLTNLDRQTGKQTPGLPAHGYSAFNYCIAREAVTASAPGDTEKDCYAIALKLKESTASV